MTLFGRREQRDGTLESPRNPLVAQRLIEMLGGAVPSASGVDVTPTSSLTMSAVFRCVSLIASVGGELPLVAYRRGSFERIDVPLLEEPHPEYTAFEFWRLMLTHRALWGNAYAQKLYDGGGQVRELWPIHPSKVKPGRVATSSANPSGKVFEVLGDDGQRHPLTSREVFHIPHLGHDGIVGLSPISLARQAIGMGLAAEEYAGKLFGSGNLLSGFISTNAVLKEDQAKRLQTNWRERMLGRHNQHDVAILDSGASFQQLTMPNSDAQFLESRQFQVPEIGRMFGVPPFLLYATEKSTSWGTGLEQQSTGFSTYDLGPQWLTPHEQRVSRELLPRNFEARYQRERLLRGDSAARGAYYSQMRQWGGMTANEVRAMEGLPPVEGGDLALQPLNMGPLGAEPDPDAVPPVPPDSTPDPEGDPDDDDPDAG